VKGVGLIQLASAALGPLCDDLVFIGGSAIGLWISDEGAPDPRPTDDVDVIVEVTTRADYEQFAERLHGRNFSEDVFGGFLGRWRHKDSDLRLDVIPTDERVFGFTNRWYPIAIEQAQELRLPRGNQIRAATPPLMLATKLEAFKNRGNDDLLGSRDFQDIVALADGRPELVAECNAASSDVRAYLVSELSLLMGHRFFADGVAGALRPDPASQARASIVIERVRAIASHTAPG
jgi:nucleotidyltransferase AbiEii toxin of type IV toxin-antitoxin system